MTLGGRHLQMWRWSRVCAHGNRCWSSGGTQRIKRNHNVRGCLVELNLLGVLNVRGWNSTVRCTATGAWSLFEVKYEACYATSTSLCFRRRQLTTFKIFAILLTNFQFPNAYHCYYKYNVAESPCLCYDRSDSPSAKPVLSQCQRVSCVHLTISGSHFHVTMLFVPRHYVREHYATCFHSTCLRVAVFNSDTVF